MTPDRSESINRAGQLATIFSSFKALGLHDRVLFNDVLRRVLVANPGLLGVWSVWEPEALDGRDAEHAGTPGHDESGRFVPFWHRHGGGIQLEPNTDYDNPESKWYFTPSRCGEEVVIDPYEYPVAGKNLFITSQAAPIFHDGKCVGVAGFDVHMDRLIGAEDEPGGFEPLEAALGRGHVLLDDDGEIRYCGLATRRLICRYVGGRPGPVRRLPDPLHERVMKTLEGRFFFGAGRPSAGWTFAVGSRRLVVRFTRLPHQGGLLLLVDEQAGNGRPAGPSSGLSPREEEVAQWMSQGKSNEEIGIILGISAHTVKNHLDKIFRKLGVENRYAAALAMRRSPSFAQAA